MSEVQDYKRDSFSNNDFLSSEEHYIYIPFFVKENIWESGDFSKSLHLFSYELFSYLREITDLLKRPHLWFFFPLGESKITKELFKGERNHWCSLTASFIQCV